MRNTYQQHSLRPVLVGAALAFLVMAATAQNVAPNMRIGTNFRAIGWGGPAALSGGSWNSAFLQDIQPYAVLRFMEWQRINETTATSWSSRTESDGVSYAMMVDLCNRNGSDGWWCIPARADDSFPRELARLLRDNLNDNLVAYIEFGNELWNTSSLFVHNVNYAAAMAEELGLSPATITEPVMKAAYFSMYRLARIYTIFEEEYGSQLHSRVRFIAGSHVANTHLTTTLINALMDSKVNPDQVVIDGFGIAPYIGHERDGSDLAGLMTEAEGIRVGAHLASIVRTYNAHYGCNAKLVGYEGGQHITTNASAFSLNPQAYDVYIALLDNVGRLMDLFCHYTHVGAYTYGTAWGAKQYVGQPVSEAHKYRALIDWANAHPYTPDAPVASRPFTVISGRVSSALSPGIEVFDLTGRLVLPPGVDAEMVDGLRPLVRKSQGTTAQQTGVFILR